MLSSRANCGGVEPRKDRMPDRSAAAYGYSSWPLRRRYAYVTISKQPRPSQTMMRFYTQQHRFYCGVDLHARTLSLCILDPTGAIVYHDTIAATGRDFLSAVAPFRSGGAWYLSFNVLRMRRKTAL